jgi:hypothetical protein
MNKLLADYQAILEIMLKDPKERVDYIQNPSRRAAPCASTALSGHEAAAIKE